MRKSTNTSLKIILLSFALGIYSYYKIPPATALRCNFASLADWHFSGFQGIFLVPAVSAAVFALFVLIPRMKFFLKRGWHKSRKYYDGFMVLVVIFLFYFYLLTILLDFGLKFDLVRMLSPAFGVLFYYLGISVANIKKNWFAGIRAPGALGNDEIWHKVSRMTSWLFKIAGLAAVFGILFPKLIPSVFLLSLCYDSFYSSLFLLGA